MNAEAMEIYQQACARYTAAVVDATRARDEAAAAYRAEVARLRQPAQQAVAERDSADTEAAAAKRLASETDEACDDIWRRLGSYVGASRLGVPPEPATEVRMARPEQVTALLERTRRNIALVRRGELPFSPPKYAVPIAVGIGLIAGAIAAVGAGLLLSYSGDGQYGAAVAQAAALVMIFVGVFIPIPVVTGWLAVHHRIGVQPVHVAGGVGGALLAMLLIIPWVLLI